MDQEKPGTGSPAEFTEDLPLTGHALMDSQHRRLLQAMELLAESLNTPFPQESLEIRMRRVRDLAAEHFEAEEALMESAGYPYLEAHRAEHQVLSERCEGLAASYGTPYAPTLPGLCAAVRALFYRHVEVIDRDYAAFLGSVPPA
jgi:hemerythrin